MKARLEARPSQEKITSKCAYDVIRELAFDDENCKLVKKAEERMPRPPSDFSKSTFDDKYQTACDRLPAHYRGAFGNFGDKGLRPVENVMRWTFGEPV